jgi:hypothetical protein
LQPGAPFDAAPPALRLRLRARVGPTPDAAQALLVSGRVSSSHLRQIEDGLLSQALADRVVPTLAWHDGATLVIAPTMLLEAELVYSVALGQPRFAQNITVSSAPEWPLLRRIWPPAGMSASHDRAVWCGDAELDFESAALGPGGSRLEPGVAPDAPGRHCAHRAEAVGGEGQPDLIHPPLVALGTSEVLLEPIPARIEAEHAPAVARACTAHELPFGPGCARVLDDRLIVKPPAEPLLWAIASTGGGAGGDPGGAAEGEEWIATSLGEAFVVAPLPPSSTLSLDVHILDNAGTRQRRLVQLATRPPMPHVVINEVLANAAGPEPQQEWVELYNDGAVAAELGGYLLTDVGGEAWLPDATLAPGHYALVVRDDFDAAIDYDPPPPSGALLLRVPELGKHGLSNEGERLDLYAPSGERVSQFAAAPKPKAGRSIIRVAPSAPDGAASSFARAEQPPTPCAPNELPGGG